MSGKVITFYSYKGGVGRSFALANVGVILAQWGYKVLLTDWDIEAPGLGHYFSRLQKDGPGVLDFLEDATRNSAVDHGRYSSVVRLSGVKSGNLSLMAAGDRQPNYIDRVQKLDWDRLFQKHALGRKLEVLREQWLQTYDFTLVDSRTGVTDFSGVTTVMLPDILCFITTANKQSLQGCKNVVHRAKRARKAMSVDRAALLTMPIISKFERNDEYRNARQWRDRFSSSLREEVSDWIPREIEMTRLIDDLTIPYVPRWNFGEELCALAEPANSGGVRSTSFPATFAIETVASILANDFQDLGGLQAGRDDYVRAAQSRIRERTRPISDSPRAFLSYKRSDSGAVDPIRQLLVQLGVNVWSDHSIEPGVHWPAELNRALESADSMLVVVGTEFSRSQQVELDRFMRSRFSLSSSRKRVLPIVLPNAENAFLSSPLSDFQAIFMGSGTRQIGLEDLGRHLQQFFEDTDLAPANVSSGIGNSDAWNQSIETLDKITARTLSFAEVAIARKDYDAAEAALLAALDRTNSRSHAPASGEVLKILSDVRSAKSDWQSAEKYYRDALSFYDPRRHREKIADIFNSLGIIAQHQGDLESAEKHFRESLNILHRRPPKQ